MRSFIAFVGLAIAARGDSLTWPIFSNSAAFVSPPIGLGVGGGHISASISLNDPLEGTYNIVSVLSDKQLDAWKKAADSNIAVEPKAFVSSFFQAFEKKVNFSLTLPLNAPERYYLVISFPPSKADDNDQLTPSGEMQVDWEQSDGRYLQFQFLPLPNALRVLLNLFIIFASLYAFHLLVNFRLANRLQFFFLFVFVYGAVFLSSWISAIETESTTGARETWDSKYFPSILEKGFDVLEVLVYVLTALGWKTLRPSLSFQELQMLGILSFLSLVLGALETVCGDDQIMCGSFSSARMIMHMFGFLAAIVAFNYHIAFLSAHIRESGIAAPETGAMYVKLSQFRWFRIIFLLFIVQPTVAVIIRTDILDWFDDWLFLAIFWASKTGLIAAVAFVFRPVSPRMPLVDQAIKQRRVQQQS